MAASFVVEIDIEKLRENSKVAGEEITIEQAESFLHDVGFRRCTNGWICEEISLDAIDRSEIKSIRPI